MCYVLMFYAIRTKAGCSTFVLTTYCSNYVLLNFGKLFSGRYSLRDLQVSEYHIVERFQSCEKYNSENGYIPATQLFTGCAT